MKLLRDLVLLAPLPKPDRTSSGIHMPVHYNDDASQYRVAAVGPKVPEEIIPGARVLADVTIDVKHTFEDGRLIVKADQIRMVW